MPFPIISQRLRGPAINLNGPVAIAPGVGWSVEISKKLCREGVSLLGRKLQDFVEKLFGSCVHDWIIANCWLAARYVDGCDNSVDASS